MRTHVKEIFRPLSFPAKQFLSLSGVRFKRIHTLVLLEENFRTIRNRGKTQNYNQPSASMGPGVRLVLCKTDTTGSILCWVHAGFVAVKEREKILPIIRHDVDSASRIGV